MPCAACLKRMLAPFIRKIPPFQHTIIRVCVVLLLFFSDLFHNFYDIKLHHSKPLASFLFLITAALAIKTSHCSRPRAPECFAEVSRVSANVALFNFMVDFLLDLLLCVCC